MTDRSPLLTAVSGQRRTEVAISNVSRTTEVPASPFFQYNYYLGIVGHVAISSGLDRLDSWRAPTLLFRCSWSESDLTAAQTCAAWFLQYKTLVYPSWILAFCVFVMAVARWERPLSLGGVVFFSVFLAVHVILWTYALAMYLINAYHLRKSHADALQIPVGEWDSVLESRANALLEVRSLASARAVP
jgi:hypothetical protein